MLLCIRLASIRIASATTTPIAWPQYTNVTDRTDKQQTDNCPIAYGESFYNRLPKKQETHQEMR